MPLLRWRYEFTLETSRRRIVIETSQSAIYINREIHVISGIPMVNIMGIVVMIVIIIAALLVYALFLSDRVEDYKLERSAVGEATAPA